MEARNLTPGDILGAADLVKLPILTKTGLRTHAKDLMTRSLSAQEVFWNKTGGTTGEPIRVAKTRESRAWESMCLERGIEWGGLRFDEPRVRLFGGSLGLRQPRLSTRLGELLRPDVFVPAFELRSDTAAGYIARIRRSGLRFAIGYASALYRLAVLAEDLGEQLRLTAVFPTAELMLPEWETSIRRAFQCSVLPYYGCGEVNSLGFSKHDRGAYYIPDEHAVIEVVSANGGATLRGDGPFLITDLDNYAMPLLRYQNGDAGRIGDTDGDEAPFSRIERVDGRYNSLLMTDNGDLISGVIGTHIFREVTSVQAYQVVQEEPRRIVIKIVQTLAYTESDERLILRLFRRHLGEGMQINLQKVASIPIPPSGKSVFVINRCLEDRLGSHGAQAREQN
jgi:phenylacetate-CoA ligase